MTEHADGRPAGSMRAPATAGPTWRLRYLQLVTASLIRGIGLPAATWLSAALARGIFDLNPPIRRHFQQTLRTYLGENEREHERLTRNAFEHVGRFWVELLYARRRLGPQNWYQHVKLSNAFEWDDLACGSRPLVLVTADLGNPVVAAIAASQLLGCLTVPIDPLARMLAPTIEPIEADGRVSRWPELHWVDARDAVTSLGRTLDRGGNILLMARPQRDGRGVSCRFFGQKVRCSALPALLANRHGARLIFLVCRRQTQPMQFELCGPEEVPVTDRPAADTQEIVHRIAKYAQWTPEQYLWSRL